MVRCRGLLCQIAEARRREERRQRCRLVKEWSAPCSVTGSPAAAAASGRPRAAACRCCADARSSPCAWPLARAAVSDSPCCPAVVARRRACCMPPGSGSPASPPPPALGDEHSVWVWMSVCDCVSAWL
uniref:Uncharacterized protein n=1 Tax=Setaria viridis TaxID=4556 RepID=A0A4U6T5P5_SETVI|nr:hypothetical protein SEVIR_9G402600v2 [Setaria viridis]